MEGNALVLDISSDAEEESKSSEKKEEREGDKVVVEYDWIKHFFDVSDEELEQGNEVVVVVDEVKKKNEEEATLSSKCSSIISEKPVNDEGEEDDCVILDCDPEKSVNSVEQQLSESDELLVVGEKGQIACRDYPHPRHLCGNYPFSSTPHQSHCDKCHCFVCDSLAPCPKWGTGLLTTDHCHATDRSSMWKTLRKNFKLGKNAPFPVSTNYAISHDVRHPQCNIIQPHWSANLMLSNQTSSSASLHTWSTISSPSLIPQNQPLRPALMHTRSSPNSSFWNRVAQPNSTIPVRSTATNLSHSFPRQLLGVRNHAIGKQRGRSGTTNVGLQFRGSHMMSSNVGSIGSNTATHHSTLVSSGSNNNVNPSWQCDRYRAAAGLSSNNTHRPNYGWGNGAETQAYCQSNHSQNFYGSWIQVNGPPTRCEPRALGLPFWIQGNGAVQSSYVAHINTNQQLSTQHQIGSCQNENNVQGNMIQCGITKQDTCEQKSQSEYATKSVFSAFDSNWAEITSQSTHQRSAVSMDQPSNVKASGTQFSGSTNLTSFDDIKDWLLGDQDSVPVVADAAPEVKIPSPALGKIDTGMFLSDFDNSFEW
ncbi:unnamed protein product [Lupinus luteus]|uniref:Uncharacterized protein n=1 Tax=Lupinus luteus TaxID=3873 RepID=A0AAV1WKF6_LUPLU